MGYNKITLHGGQVCDYLYIQNTVVPADSFNSVDSEPTEWNNNTVMFSKFDNNLAAGDSSLTESIKGYELRRKKGTAAYTEYVTTIQNDNKKYVIDYLAANKTPYTYYLYPTSSSENSDIILPPSISKEVVPNWNYWSLLIVDETDNENVFYLNKMFKFELNLSTKDMSNNAIISITPNFTKYPTIQYSPANYWSGGLTALCGFISCNDDEYIQTPNMIDELKALTSDTRRKFLKDTEGHVWEVKITAPITISTEDNTLEDVKTVSISWTEVGEVNGISVINNPDSSSIEWLLTETGEVKPYITYTWDNQYIWDNSYRWTPNEETLDTDYSNMSRGLFDKESDT